MILNNLPAEFKQKILEYLTQEMHDLRRAIYAEDSKIEEYQALIEQDAHLAQDRQDIYFVKRIVSHDLALLDALAAIIPNRDSETVSSIKFKLEYAQSEKQAFELDYKRIQQIISELSDDNS